MLDVLVDGCGAGLKHDEIRRQHRDDCITFTLARGRSEYQLPRGRRGLVGH